MQAVRKLDTLKLKSMCKLSQIKNEKDLNKNCLHKDLSIVKDQSVKCFRNKYLFFYNDFLILSQVFMWSINLNFNITSPWSLALMDI